MPYRTGTWGDKAKERHKRRGEYFRNYARNKLQCEPSIGYMGELEAVNMLSGSTRAGKREYDVLWGEKRIEVKTSSFHKESHGWRFLVAKQRGKCDLFLLICKDENGKTFRIFLIPDQEITQKQTLCITLFKIDMFEKYALKVR